HGALTQAFPVGTGRRPYPWWDANARRAFVARFLRTEVLRGVTVYRFRVSVPSVRIDRVAVPASAVDESGSRPIALDWWYRSETDLWVEPASGVIVKGSQIADQWLANRAGKRRLTVATTELEDTPATVASNLRHAGLRRDALRARAIWPILLGPLVGVMVLAVGMVRSAGLARTSAPRSGARRPRPGAGSRHAPATGRAFR
ncbi:MAG: porin PorA family protein, partial [Actinomycetota bacterium]